MFYYDFNNKVCEGIYYVADDTSIIYKYTNETDMLEEVALLDYTISLGNSSRLLMDLYHKTGKCGPLRCFMTGIKIIEEDLKIPQSRKGELYFKLTEGLFQYSGTMYMMCKDTCYYDEKNNIVCIGEPKRKGECIEFTENTYAVINRNDLVAVFMKVNNVKEHIVIKKGRICSKE